MGSRGMLMLKLLENNNNRLSQPIQTGYENASLSLEGERRSISSINSSSGVPYSSVEDELKICSTQNAEDGEM
ncbi:unnamed protein product [Callosobruchus maculatus]|uniref:Uncharacterized protein n=1 Tax=Callosobruchus maculatus TaxID=64391 RepID=A0A653BVG1_CALMS|nr:unnamed protein product [Callosobruchus maculatus]